MTAHASVHVLIRGRVQGVGYRAWAAARAKELNLSGYVRNRRDGSVEAVFAGSTSAVERMLELCREGPLGASVSEVETVGQGVSAFKTFEVLPTA